MEPDHSSISEVYTRIEERRIELYKDVANMAPALGKLLVLWPKICPKTGNGYTLMHDNQPENVPTYCNL